MDTHAKAPIILRDFSGSVQEPPLSDSDLGLNSNDLRLHFSALSGQHRSAGRACLSGPRTDRRAAHCPRPGGGWARRPLSDTTSPERPTGREADRKLTGRPRAEKPTALRLGPQAGRLPRRTERRADQSAPSTGRGPPPESPPARPFAPPACASCRGRLRELDARAGEEAAGALGGEPGHSSPPPAAPGTAARGSSRLRPAPSPGLHGP